MLKTSLKCEYFQAFLVVYHSKLNIFGFWTVDQTKQVILRCHRALWELCIFAICWLSIDLMINLGNLLLFPSKKAKPLVVAAHLCHI